MTWDALGHDAEGAVGQLFYAPELFVCTTELRNGHQLQIGRSSQCTVSTRNDDFVIGAAQIAASLGNRR